MTSFDRELNNRPCRPPQIKANYSKPAKKGRNYYVAYRAGKYVIIDLDLKKGGHSQR